MIDIRPISHRMVLESDTLLAAHWEEVAKNKDLMVLKPNEANYDLAAANGQVFTLGVFDGEQLIGYSLNFFGQHLHYSELTVAENDVIYLVPEYRNAHVGALLIEQTELEAMRLGARLMLWHAKESTPLASILTRRCDVQDIVFSKVL